jgi:transposase-like protein
MSKKPGVTIYSEDFKWEVVQEVLHGRMSKEEARVAYGIKGNCSILYWMRKFSGNEDYRSVHTFGENTNEMSKPIEQKKLETKVKELEEDLRKVTLRADLWRKMIEVAERELNIDIKKKYGAQRSKRSEKK